jgi:hypothetical protein
MTRFKTRTSTITLFTALVAAPAALAALAAACGSAEPSAPPPAQHTGVPVFTVQVGAERFKVQATTAASLAALRSRLQSGIPGVILGSLASGDGGVNAPYQWHLVPTTVTAADVATEVCDGRPSDVQGNLNYWLTTVRSYCPWSAKVVAEQ